MSTEENKRELEALIERLSPYGLMLMTIFIKAFDHREKAGADAGPESVLARLRLVEAELGCVSLRDEMALARRGELHAAHLNLKALGELGIAPEWILAGDLDALGASMQATGKLAA